MACPAADSSRPNRSAAARREQYRRADARRIQHLLKGFEAVSSHRGCAPSRLGAALQRLLAEAGPNATAAPEYPGAGQQAGWRAAEELAAAWRAGWDAGAACASAVMPSATHALAGTVPWTETADSGAQGDDAGADSVAHTGTLTAQTAAGRTTTKTAGTGTGTESATEANAGTGTTATGTARHSADTDAVGHANATRGDLLPRQLQLKRYCFLRRNRTLFPSAEHMEEEHKRLHKRSPCRWCKLCRDILRRQATVLFREAGMDIAELETNFSFDAELGFVLEQLGESHGTSEGDTWERMVSCGGRIITMGTVEEVYGNGPPPG